MNLQEYIQDAVRTAAPVNPALERLNENKMILLHAAIGMVTEAGEFIDVLKKNIFYGKQIDYVNLKEELGDMCWYIALAMYALTADWEEVLITNIEKLKYRFPDKFTTDAAINRNLTDERKILEQAKEFNFISAEEAEKEWLKPDLT